MKKIVLAIILLIIISQIGRSIEVSPIIGFGFCKYLASDWISEVVFSFKPSMILGGEIDVNLANNIKLASGLYFSFRGSKARIRYSSKDYLLGNYKMNVLTLPLDFKLSLGKKWNPYLSVGSEIFMVLSHQLILDNHDNFKLKEKTNTVGVGVEIGIGTVFKLLQKQCFCELLYLHGISNIYKDEKGNMISQSNIKLVLGMVLVK